MKIKNEVKQLLKQSGFNPDLLLMTVLQIYYDIGLKLNQDHIIWLSTSKLIVRNTNGELELTFALHENEEDPDFKIQENTQFLVQERVNEYRDIFRGIRNGSIGEKRVVSGYLTRFMLEEKVTFDDILRVTQMAKQNSDEKFFPNADNFIYSFKGENETSQLRIAFDTYDTIQENSTFI